MRGNRLLSPLINVQFEYIRAGIVPHNIEVVLSTNDLRAIDLGNQNRLAFGVGSGEKVPKKDRRCNFPRALRLRPDRHQDQRRSQRGSRSDG